MDQQEKMAELQALMQDLETLPKLHLTTNELRIISHALYGYSNYLYSQGSEKHRKLLDALWQAHEHLVEIVVQMLKGKNGDKEEPLFGVLTFEDLETISDALVGSIRNIKRTIAKSQERDQTIEGLYYLRERVQKMIDAILADSQY